MPTYEDNAKARALQKSQRDDLQMFLSLLNDAGFQTNKGSNTYTLAGVITDFVHRIIDQRKQDLSILSLWETEDTAVLVPLMYARYRIYNERHHPQIFDISSLNLQNAKEFDEVQGYRKLVHIGDGKLAALANVKKFTIAKLSNEEPTPLGIRYDDLLTGSKLVLDSKEYFESYTSETGVFHERDFVILPDERGIAVFYPILDFKKALGFDKDAVIELTLLTRPAPDAQAYEFDQVKDFVEITPDLLKFTLTQLMARFPTQRGQSLAEFQEYLQNKFGIDSFIYQNYIFADLKPLDFEELNNFAERNVFNYSGNLKVPGKCRVWVELENKIYQKELMDFIKKNLTKYEIGAMLEEKVYKLVEVWFATKFALSARTAMQDNPTKVDVAPGDDAQVHTLYFEPTPTLRSREDGE